MIRMVGKIGEWGRGKEHGLEGRIERINTDFLGGECEWQNR